MSETGAVILVIAIVFCIVGYFKKKAKDHGVDWWETLFQVVQN